MPGGPIDTGRSAARSCGSHTAVRDRSDRFRALQAILARAAAILGRARGAPIQTTELAEERRLARTLDRADLVVQGPPGHRQDLDRGAADRRPLIADGKRVGVTAMSHKAINNLLDEVETRPRAGSISTSWARASQPANSCPSDGRIQSVDESAACLDPQYGLVAARRGCSPTSSPTGSSTTS